MAAKPQAILLLSPPSEFYAYLLKGLAQGFKSHGYPCNWLNTTLEPEKVAAWARRSNACVVLEINRVRAPEIDWPKNVAHVAWIQDYRAYGRLVTHDLGTSDHLYFIVQPAVLGVEPPVDRAWSILPPGVRVSPDLAEIPPQRDFCFAGFIPAPLDPQIAVSRMPDGRVVTLGEFLKHFPSEALLQSQTSLLKSNRAIDETCARIGCVPLAEDWARELFDESLVRTLERRKLIQAVLGVSKSLDIYGPPNWKAWSQFAPHYRGFVNDPLELDRIFRTTRINLHNGILTMHFRVLDCLAVGGFIMVNDTELDHMPGSIRTYLEPHRHYAPYRMDDIATALKHYLGDAALRQKIAAEGQREVLASHTWAHRAAQILRDLDLPLRGAASQRAATAA